LPVPPARSRDEIKRMAARTVREEEKSVAVMGYLRVAIRSEEFRRSSMGATSEDVPVCSGCPEIA
ncbi:MAG TPA: hypothetical protein VMH23_10670, partial [Bacteroidota bacterium]|nr:hypothetical protein [Bacteroidota bacterium]